MLLLRVSLGGDSVDLFYNYLHELRRADVSLPTVPVAEDMQVDSQGILQTEEGANEELLYFVDNAEQVKAEVSSLIIAKEEEGRSADTDADSPDSDMLAEERAKGGETDAEDQSIAGMSDSLPRTQEPLRNAQDESGMNESGNEYLQDLLDFMDAAKDRPRSHKEDEGEEEEHISEDQERISEDKENKYEENENEKKILEYTIMDSGRDYADMKNIKVRDVTLTARHCRAAYDLV